VKDSTDVIASSAVLAAQLEIDPQISLAALKIARKHGVCDTYSLPNQPTRTPRHTPALTRYSCVWSR